MPSGAWLKQQVALAVVGNTTLTALTHVYVALLTGLSTRRIQTEATFGVTWNRFFGPFDLLRATSEKG